MTDVPPAGDGGGAAHARLLRPRWSRSAARSPRDDLTGALLAAEIDGDRLDDVEIIGFLFLMIIAGNETTTKLLGNALYWLWRNPDQRRLVRRRPDADPALGRGDAALRRLDAGAGAHGRRATSSCTARRMRDGDRVVLLVGSANRDERVFPDPDRYDVLRDTSAMLSFGQGTHFCLGASLARLEGRVALEEVQRRFPDYEIEPGGHRARPLGQRARLRGAADRASRPAGGSA